MQSAYVIEVCQVSSQNLVWHIKTQEIREGMDISEYVLCEKSEQTLDNVKLKERDKE